MEPWLRLLDDYGWFSVGIVAAVIGLYRALRASLRALYRHRGDWVTREHHEAVVRLYATQLESQMAELTRLREIADRLVETGLRSRLKGR